jgi:hypothetical protein
MIIPAGHHDDGHGGTASKRPIDDAGPAATVDGSSKTHRGAGRPQPLGRRQTDAGAHSPLENRHTTAGFPHRQQAISSSCRQTEGTCPTRRR